jgi:hypothetical protein
MRKQKEEKTKKEKRREKKEKKKVKSHPFLLIQTNSFLIPPEITSVSLFFFLFYLISLFSFTLFLHTF